MLGIAVDKLAHMYKSSLHRTNVLIRETTGSVIRAAADQSARSVKLNAERQVIRARPNSNGTRVY